MPHRDDAADRHGGAQTGTVRCEAPLPARAEREDQIAYEARDWHIAAVLFVLASALFGFSARLRMVRGHFGGDEPHYLVFNVLLRKYHEIINVMPVYRNKDYVSFYPGTLQPHVVPGPDGRPLPLHGFGGPLLWHLPYLLWGAAGAVTFIVVVSALVVVNIYYFLRELGIVRLYAAIVTALFAVGTPIYVFSSMVFVEPIGALGVLFATRALCRRDLGGWRLAVASTGLGILPWVHGRYAPFTVTIGALLLWRLWRENRLSNVRLYLKFLLPIGALLIGFAAYDLVVWHSLSPVPANAQAGDGVLQIPVYHGLPRIVFDRTYGLVVNFPLFLLVLPGVLLALRRGLWQLHLTIGLVVVPYVVLASTFKFWWAGYSPPGRFLVAVVPLLSYYVAVTLQRMHHSLMIAFATLCGLSAYLIAVTADVIPVLRMNRAADKSNPLLERVGDLIGFSIVDYLPNGFVGGQRRIFLLWIVGLVGFGVAVWLLGRWLPSARTPEWPVRLLGSSASSAGPKAETR